MTDEDLKAAFRSLEPIKPSSAFLRSVREIPARFPREETGAWWRWLFAPQRLAALAVASMIGLSVGYATVDDDRSAVDIELADSEWDEMIELAPGDDASQVLDQLYDLETEEL